MSRWRLNRGPQGSAAHLQRSDTRGDRADRERKEERDERHYINLLLISASPTAEKTPLTLFHVTPETNEHACYISSDKGCSWKTMALDFWFNQPLGVIYLANDKTDQSRWIRHERGKGKYLILTCRLIWMKYTRYNEEASADGVWVRASTARQRLKPAAGSASRTRARRDWWKRGRVRSVES